MYGIWYTVSGHGRRHADWLRNRTTREVVRFDSEHDAREAAAHLMQNLGRHRLYLHYSVAPIPFEGAIR